jgi:hypothetical protein
MRLGRLGTNSLPCHEGGKDASVGSNFRGPAAPAFRPTATTAATSTIQLAKHCNAPGPPLRGGTQQRRLAAGTHHRFCVWTKGFLSLEKEFAASCPLSKKMLRRARECKTSPCRL